MQVAGMPAYTDLSKAHEVANLARRLQKDLRDAIGDAAKYNNRERLFDMPISNVSSTHLLATSLSSGPGRAVGLLCVYGVSRQ